MKRLVAAAVLSVLPVLVGACNFRENRSGLHWFLDMHDSLAVEAQEEDPSTSHSSTAPQQSAGASPALGGPSSSIRVPPEGTVARNHEPYLIRDAATAGQVLRNPLPATESILARGQDQFGVFCSPCHGNLGGNRQTGRGDGSVVPRFPESAIPGLVGPKANAPSMKDGEIFHMITVGRNAMKPYEAQISAADRWAIVHYLRLLQKAARN